MTAVPLTQADPARLAIFLDFDGCLVDLAPRPQDVVVPHLMVPVLQRLWRMTGGALVLVSGRSVAELRCLLPRLWVPICGSHGAERALSGRRVLRMEVDQAALARAAESAARSLMATPGLLLERKPVGLGLHYRGAPDRAGDVAALADQLLVDLPGFHAHHGKMVVELRPNGIGKGHAVRDMMRRAAFVGRTPVMFGDDTTDEPAFNVANAMGGLSVKIGKGETCARYRLANPQHLRRLLARWAIEESFP